MSVRWTVPVNRAEIGPIFTATVALMSVSEDFSRLSQPGMLTLSTSGSLSACHTTLRGAAMRRSPVMSIRLVPVVRAGRYLQGGGHATKRAGPGVGLPVPRDARLDRPVSPCWRRVSRTGPSVPPHRPHRHRRPQRRAAGQCLGGTQAARQSAAVYRPDAASALGFTNGDSRMGTHEWV